ncbi:MAG: CHRD domain-containing protein [Pseudomonadota bacterium]
MNIRLLAAASLAVFIGTNSVVADDDIDLDVLADGFQEVPAALFTPGTAELRLRDRGDSIRYRFTFRDLTGNIENSVGAHIHFGRPGINGGIITFVCGTVALPGPAGTPPCFSDGLGNGRVRGSITAETILGIPGQGFPANDLNAFREAVEARAVYLNVHTDAFPSGEVRGDFLPLVVIEADDDEDDDDDDDD